MDAYGQIGPEKGEYAADVRDVSRCLTGATVHVALADRGTCLGMFLTTAEDLSMPKGGKMPAAVRLNEGYVLVALPDHGAYWFKLDGGYHAPGYVAERLGLGQGDGEIVAEFLTRLDVEINGIVKEVAEHGR